MADVSLPPLSDMQRRERPLRNGTVQIRAEHKCRRWHKDGTECDGRLAAGEIMTHTIWLLFSGVTEETFLKCNWNASDLYQGIFIFDLCGLSSSGFIQDTWHSMLQRVLPQNICTRTQDIIMNKVVLRKNHKQEEETKGDNVKVSGSLR